MGRQALCVGLGSYPGDREVNTLSRLFHDSLTEIDGSSYAIVKVLSFLLVLVFLGLTIASFVTGKAFDPISYGTAAGLVIASMAAGIRLTDPPKKDPP